MVTCILLRIAGHREQDKTRAYNPSLSMLECGLWRAHYFILFYVILCLFHCIFK